MSEFATYVSRDKVRARRVLTKSETVVTTNGVTTARQHDYIIEDEKHGVIETRVLSNDEFNDQYKRSQTDREALDAKYKEGYEDGWRACQDANDTADSVVSPPESEGNDTADSVATAPETESNTANTPLPPVGDTLEENGPVKVRDLPS